jgi:hypothetical protein
VVEAGQHAHFFLQRLLCEQKQQGTAFTRVALKIWVVEAGQHADFFLQSLLQTTAIKADKSKEAGH